MSLPGLSNPVWAQTGTELRALADAFATSHQRRELRCKAQQTDLTVISWDRFRQLLEELFSVRCCRDVGPGSVVGCGVCSLTAHLFAVQQ